MQSGQAEMFPESRSLPGRPCPGAAPQPAPSSSPQLEPGVSPPGLRGAISEAGLFVKAPPPPVSPCPPPVAPTMLQQDTKMFSPLGPLPSAAWAEAGSAGGRVGLGKAQVRVP